MLCQVCGKNEYKYTCPACQIKTCCVDCIKRHKKETGCTGIKPKTSFVPLEKMDSSMLQKDCVLIDQTRTAVINAGLKLPKNKKGQWQKILEKQCQERGITIRFMPREMTRAQENTTRCRSKSDQVIYWTCRFRFRDENKNIMYDTLLHNQVETSHIIDIFNAIIETAPNDFVAKVNIDTFTILLLAEGAAGGGYFEIDTTASLGDNMFSKTIIEYPIFDVVPTSCLSNYNIVNELNIRNIEIPSEKPVVNDKKELPSYEMIKEALKRDIINGVLKSSQLKEEQNVPLPPDFNPSPKKFFEQK